MTQNASWNWIHAGFAAVRQRSDELLAQHPGLTVDHPYFQTRKGAKWLAAYTDPKAVEKHLHNHKDYQFYDGTLPETREYLPR